MPQNDVLPGDLVLHKYTGFGPGIVLKTWYEEDLMAEVKWGVPPRFAKSSFLKIKASLLEIISEKL